MAKLKEVRALKSSGVEPLAPTLIKRILHNLVLNQQPRALHHLSKASAVAGNVWSRAAGVLLDGLLRSHQCDLPSPAILRGAHFGSS
jgi:hypothetical protein